MELKYFKLSEFDQKGLPGSGGNMDAEFLKKLDILRGICEFPFLITSGYRTPEYNQKVSHSGPNGPHTTGKAVDIAVSRDQAFILLERAFKMNYFTGIGINQKGSSRFIHLDSVEGDLRPTVWSY